MQEREENTANDEEKEEDKAKAKEGEKHVGGYSPSSSCSWLVAMFMLIRKWLAAMFTLRCG